MSNAETFFVKCAPVMFALRDLEDFLFDTDAPEEISSVVSKLSSRFRYLYLQVLQAYVPESSKNSKS